MKASQNETNHRKDRSPKVTEMSLDSGSIPRKNLNLNPP